MLVYVDNILIIDVNPDQYMSMLCETCTIKESNIGSPTACLGANIGKIEYCDGTCAWTMSSDTYVKEAMRNAKKRLAADDFIFNKKLFNKSNSSCDQPFSSLSCRPELNTSVECTPD